MRARPANDGLPWTRDQLILAFELYCRVPFGKITTRNPRIQELAAALQRTPASVTRKLGNFGAFDPVLAARNVSGLTHASRLDREIWNEFHDDWNRLVEKAHALRTRLRVLTNTSVEMLQPPTGSSERVVTARQRLHQAFFRAAVFSSYDNRCCITGIPIRECLIAGHIIPWSVDERRRADPTNGLCLSATFDRLFDCGLVTIEDDLTLRISSQVRNLRDQSVAELITVRNGQAILPPARFFPDPVCLRWHRENRFQAA